MSRVSPAALKAAWIEAVERMLCLSEPYRVSSKFDGIFDSVATKLGQEGIDPSRFCEAQVYYVKTRNLTGKLWPSLLSGDRAMERYEEYPDPESRKEGLRQNLNMQLETFKNVTRTISLEAAFYNKLASHTPIFMVMMHVSFGRDIPEDLLEEARAEAGVEPLWRYVLSQKVLGVLDAKS